MENNNTDMLAEARNAQWSALTFLGKGSVRAVAPAKVNLFLGVGERLESCYHKVTTVMHALALHDTLYINCIDAEDDEDAPSARTEDAKDGQTAIAGSAGNLRVSITMADKTAGLGRTMTSPLQVPVDRNLVFRAIDALARQVAFTAQRKIKVHIEKQIPSQAGLGGGSADAAAALAAMAHFWGIPANDGLLDEAAAEVGSDVAFFLRGGCGLYDGGGERFQHALAPSSKPVVLVKPSLGVPTREAYAAFDKHPAPLPPNLVARAGSADTAQQVPLFNNLASAASAVTPELVPMQKWLADKLAAARAETEDIEASAGSAVGSDDACAIERGPLLTGSGSAMFAIADSFAQASAIAAAAQAQGWWSRATTLSRLRATVVEA